jgi:hypothetical protein
MKRAKVLIEFRDPVVESVVSKFVSRSNVGFEKYGKTLREDKSDLFTWLNHVQEELMDATLYLQRLKEEITNLREEKILLESVNDIDVVDSFIYEEPRRHLNRRSDLYDVTIDDDDDDDDCVCKARWAQNSTDQWL